MIEELSPEEQAIARRARENDLGTVFSIEEECDGVLVTWWTNDNADLGYASQEACRMFKFDTLGKAYRFVRQYPHDLDKFGTKQPIKNSWYDLHGQRVGVFVNGELLPLLASK